jgi:hypothetical protein
VLTFAGSSPLALRPCSGQAGVQIGNACWELYTIEHGLSVSTVSSLDCECRPWRVVREV